MVMQTHTEYYQDGVQTVSTTTGDYLCDSDGMWAVALYTEYSEEANGSVNEGWSRVTYTNPALVLPYDLEDGTAWSTVAEGTAEYSSGVTSDINLLTESVVEGSESVSVPAGNYDALRVQSVYYTGATETTSTTSWLYPSVGTVKDAVSELVRHDP